jgi:hypothetical protein
MSVVETRRDVGRVVHEHVASLGSVEVPASVADRIAFWRRLHERLARLSNRLDGEAQGKVLAAVHAHVPMPSIDEQRALQLANAKAELEQWGAIRGLHVSTVEDHKKLADEAAARMAQFD